MPPTSLTLTPPDAEWMAKAACRGMWWLMESTEDADVKAARDLCRSCPVWEDCRTWALSLPPRHEVAGMAGGLTEEERAKARRCVRRRRISATEPPRSCNGCGSTKPAGEFYPRPADRGGREAQCMDCRRRQNREYKAAQRAASRTQAVTS